MNFKKGSFLSTLTFLSLGAVQGPLFADLGEISQSDSSQKPHMKNSGESYRPYYYAPDSKGFFVYGEFIYWEPFTQSPLNWVEKVDLKRTPQFQTLSQDVDLRSLDYDFSAGFRVGAGYRFARNTFDSFIRPWQIELEYTHLRAEDSGSAKAEGTTSATELKILQTLLPVFGFNGSLDKAHSRIALDYDRLDFKLAWPVWIRHNVILRLFGGATFAWFENNWKTRYDAIPILGHVNVNHTDLKWEWWGGGILGGGDIYLSVGKGFGFFADASLGLLLGPMETREFYSSSGEIQPVFGFPPGHFKFKRHFRSFQTSLNVGIGADYKHWFSDKVMLHLALGWERTWWFDMNQYGRVNPRDNPFTAAGFLFFDKPNDLGFDGLTARLGFDF